MNPLTLLHTEKLDVDLPVRVWIDEEYEHLGYYEQIGGHLHGDYWGDLTYFSTSYDKDNLEEDIKEELEELEYESA